MRVNICWQKGRYLVERNGRGAIVIYTLGLWRRRWQPTPVLLPGKWAAVHRVAKTERRLNDFTFFLSIVPFGEGNGNPLQCSCLENPMDRGAWWATVYGVAKSQTRLNN